MLFIAHSWFVPLLMKSMLKVCVKSSPTGSDESGKSGVPFVAIESPLQSRIRSAEMSNFEVGTLFGEASS